MMIPTPHIAANKDEIAKTVLMPGDPLRSKFIADTFLDDAKLFNDIRGVNGYTGYYMGKRVSVMASGMGMPSMGIYSYELFNFYDVDNIIRIGSAGSLRDDVKIRDIVFGMSASTDSSYADKFGIKGTYAPTASYKLLECAVEKARAYEMRYHVGMLLSGDAYYSPVTGSLEPWRRMGVLAVEMEAASLYLNAAYAGKNALAICTISNSILTGVETTPEERRSTFTDMMKIALETAIQF